MSSPILIDTDNAMGSTFGDVDDAFAIAALLKSRKDICGIVSVFGNTDTKAAMRNNLSLAQLLDFRGPLCEGARQSTQPTAAPRQLVQGLNKPMRVAALGPLTNVAAYPNRLIKEVIVVGGNSISSGIWPPYWPKEFNLTQDRQATAKVFNSRLPLTLLPLNIAHRLRASPRMIRELPHPFGTYFGTRSILWSWRSLLIRGSFSFPIWDLGAAMYMVRPDLFAVQDLHAQFYPRGYLRFGNQGRKLKVICDFDANEVWQAFAALLDS